MPWAFTEQGVANLSSVLKSEQAIKANINIMRAFVKLRKFVLNNAQLFQRIEITEQKLLETDKQIGQILDALNVGSAKPKHGIFYDGQIFDAYVFVAEIIRLATNSIVLIDNYIDETVFTLFTKRKIGVTVTFYTKAITKQLLLDAQKHNEQYETIEIKEFKQSHDRFMIVDNRDIYHFGASLKDLGKSGLPSLNSIWEQLKCWVNWEISNNVIGPILVQV